MTEEKRDIRTREDIVLLVDEFYGKVRSDALLAPVFTHVNWPEHLPIMYTFWASLVFGEQTYRGNPFEKHRSLAIHSRHFKQWLDLFKTTVDENFRGENADEIKMRAGSIAHMFQFKLGLTQELDDQK